MSSIQTFESWGRLKKIQQEVYWLDSPKYLFPHLKTSQSILPFGEGRSYGDSCLNEGGALLRLTGLNRVILFDSQSGILRCEAGIRFDEILDLIVPQGWFLPVSPGTQFVTLGGAIANDIHGKNHHRAGSFGRHVTRFELLRSNNEHFICSPNENSDLYRATIGGLGLTGVILWAEIQLIPIKGPWIDCETIKFSGLEEFFDLSRQSDADFEYTVSWIDTLATGKHFGRGHFFRGNFSKEASPLKKAVRSRPIAIPFNAPNWLLNYGTIGTFNSFYYHRLRESSKKKQVHYQSFFYPLDQIQFWNRLYGKRGFYQYQFVVPSGKDRNAIEDILTAISSSRVPSFLSVLKTFGGLESPGLLSFPKPGVTLALDFPNQGQKTLDFLKALHSKVKDYGGRVYPAKDATMTPEDFQSFYPNWKEFSVFIDPKFSSSFWRRVTGGKS